MFERRQNLHIGVRPELVTHFGSDALADFDRLGKPRLERYGAASGPRQHPLAEQTPKRVDFGRDFESLLEDGRRVLHVAVVDDDLERLHAERLRMFSDHALETRGGLLERNGDFRSGELFFIELRDELIELVERYRRLARGGATGEKAPEIRFDVVDRGAVLPAFPDIRKVLGDLFERAVGTGIVAAGDDHSALRAKRVGDDADDAFAALELDLRDSLLVEERMIADEDERRLVGRFFDLLRKANDGNGHARGLEPEARRQVERSFVPIGRTQHDVDALSDEIRVAVAEHAVRRVEVREIELAFRTRTRPGRDGAAFALGRLSREAHFRAGEAHYEGLDPVIGRRAVEDRAPRDRQLGLGHVERHVKLSELPKSHDDPCDAQVLGLDGLLDERRANIGDHVGERCAFGVPEMW